MRSRRGAASIARTPKQDQEAKHDSEPYHLGGVIEEGFASSPCLMCSAMLYSSNSAHMYTIYNVRTWSSEMGRPQYRTPFSLRARSIALEDPRCAPPMHPSHEGH